MKYNDKKDIFSELINQLFRKGTFELGVKLSSFENEKLIEELKNLKLINIDKLEDFENYSNYDYFLIFKHDDEYYFCDTKMIPSLGTDSLIKLIDFKHFLRKDKLTKIIHQK